MTARQSEEKGAADQVDRLVDENAFGLWVAYYDVEDDEYALDRDEFIERAGQFRQLVLECLDAIVLGRDVRAVDFGHAVYVEIAEGDEVESPIHWLKMVRARLKGRGFETVGVLTHGSRWVSERRGFVPSQGTAGDVRLTTISNPSEPLRRALYADTATRFDDENESVGWGPGLYLDTEAVEALGKTPKNVPTVLRSGGATFFRAGA